SPDQSEVSLLDEIQEIQATPRVALGDGDHQTQVAADEQGARLFAFVYQAAESPLLDRIEIGLVLQSGGGPATLFDGASELDLVLSSEKPMIGHIIEIEADSIGGTGAPPLRLLLGPHVTALTLLYWREGIRSSPR